MKGLSSTGRFLKTYGTGRPGGMEGENGNTQELSNEVLSLRLRPEPRYLDDLEGLPPDTKGVPLKCL